MAETKTRRMGPGEKGAGHLHGFSQDQLHRFLREMLLYRRFEEKAEEAYAIAKIGGFCHLHIGQEAVTLGFLGDAAVNQGAFWESLNMAAVWKLPVIYVVENNEYGMGTAFRRVSALPVVERAAGTGVPAHSVNDQDVLACWSLTEELVAEVRRGAGPQYVEARTYRFKGHSMSDPVSGTYRAKEEVETKKEKEDPIILLRDRLFENDLLTQEELEEIDREVVKVVEDAATFAEESPPLPPKISTTTFTP